MCTSRVCTPGVSTVEHVKVSFFRVFWNESCISVVCTHCAAAMAGREMWSEQQGKESRRLPGR